MTSSAQLERESHSTRVFSAWAGVYDRQRNPLLTLEERYLLRLLPKIFGRDVLDVGCGTGRWLEHLSRLNPRSLHGIDLSPAMLSQAAAKNLPNTRLSRSSCLNLPVEDSGMDVLLTSFVLSYADDLHVAASELARVARPGGDLFLTDMHPETAKLLHWKRSFHLDGVEVNLPARSWSISELLTTFRAHGFVERAVIEPAFGAEEEEIFGAHNRLRSFEEAAHLPAICLLHLTKPHATYSRPRTASAQRDRRFLLGGRCALGPSEAVLASIDMDATTVATITTQPTAIAAGADAAIDMTGYLLMPGLINAHDHLEFALFPRLGKGPYENAEQWALDIQQQDAEIIATHRRLSKLTRLWWGAIRNLLCGVTTVCHHNPIDPYLLTQDFPVRVISDIGWEHSLAFAADPQAAYQNTGEDRPFIIHACEGIDQQSKSELRALDTLGVLDQRTVLVHGLALDEQGAALLNGRGSSLIICPSSNDFLFGETPSAAVLQSIKRLALGSDSPLTATGDLLDEIRFAAHACLLSAKELYSMVTDDPALMLRLHRGEGSLRPGSPADLIALRDERRSPADTLCSISAKDIELVLLAGCVQLASQSIFERLPLKDRDGLEPLSIDGEIRWLRAPVGDLLREAEDVLGKGAVRLGGRLVCQPSR